MTGTPIAEWLNAVARAKSRCSRRGKIKFWGQKYNVKPEFCPKPLGDGLQLMGFEVMDDRPYHYVLLVDSSWNETVLCKKKIPVFLTKSNFDSGETFCDHLDEVSEELRACFGDAHEEYEHDNGRTYKKRNPFPAFVVENCGSSWWSIAIAPFATNRRGESDDEVLKVEEQ